MRVKVSSRLFRCAVSRHALPLLPTNDVSDTTRQQQVFHTLHETRTRWTAAVKDLEPLGHILVNLRSYWFEYSQLRLKLEQWLDAALLRVGRSEGEKMVRPRLSFSPRGPQG